MDSRLRLSHLFLREGDWKDALAPCTIRLANQHAPCPDTANIPNTCRRVYNFVSSTLYSASA